MHPKLGELVLKAVVETNKELNVSWRYS